jgi:hypothetical protein
MKKTNYWKIFTIILGLLCLSLIFYSPSKTIQIAPDIKVTEDFLKGVINNIQEDSFNLCNIEKNKCYRINLIR